MNPPGRSAPPAAHAPGEEPTQRKRRRPPHPGGLVRHEGAALTGRHGKQVARFQRAEAPLLLDRSVKDVVATLVPEPNSKV
jgi:hypothetical protein